MKYHNIIGIDSGKFNFFVSVYGKKDVKTYKNSVEGIQEFLNEYKCILKKGLCIIEPTGGYELDALYALCGQSYAVHRADTRKVKNFIRSYGNKAKTDRLDAQALARYGYERQEELTLFKPISDKNITLHYAVRRREDLKKMVIAEKNRAQSARDAWLKSSCEQMLEALTGQMQQIENTIKSTIASDEILQKKFDILKSIAGIGDCVAFELLALLPELGAMNRREIAALAGVAPIARDSGVYSGYRRTAYGRGGVKPMLYMAAMAARRSKTYLKDFYENLVARGKQKKVALTALMRKIITIANAKIRDNFFLHTHQQT